MEKQFYNRLGHLIPILHGTPEVTAMINGSPEYPDINGRVDFYETIFGVLIAAQIVGLPVSDVPCKERIFAFHIHNGGSCTGNQDDPFADAMMHYNPRGCDHPNHAGDLPPLFGNDGYAFQIFLTNRFSVEEIVGKTVIIHSNPDDFTSKPAGNAGQKIACGLIEKNIYGSNI